MHHEASEGDEMEAGEDAGQPLACVCPARDLQDGRGDRLPASASSSAGRRTTDTVIFRNRVNAALIDRAPPAYPALTSAFI